MEKLFRSILEQDKAPIVVCDMLSTIIYMNSAAIIRYKKDLTGLNLKGCHSSEANKKIDAVLEWFKKSQNNNVVYTYHNVEENKDVYMVALRNENRELIGYYEKHEYRNKETAKLYDIII